MRRSAGAFLAALLVAAQLAGCGGPQAPAPGGPPVRCLPGPPLREEAWAVRAASAKPARVLEHYGVFGGGFRGYAVLDFGGAAVGAALPGAVVRVGEGFVELAAADETRLVYRGLGRIMVRSGQAVRAGDALGEADGKVELVVEKGGRLLDPVALLWPEMSRFAQEASEAEKKRAELAARIRRAREWAAWRAGARFGEALSREEAERLVREAARRAGVDPALAAAVALVESNFDARAVSPKGAVGLMQLMPEAAEDTGVSDPFSPAENARGGTEYLRRMLDRFGGDLVLALAAYNAGPGAVEKHGGIPPFPETQEYVRKVLEAYRALKAHSAERR
ncbi:MAG: lytic transglycosylase domain-containing protein [Moorellales bacterium]